MNDLQQMIVALCQAFQDGGDGAKILVELKYGELTLPKAQKLAQELILNGKLTPKDWEGC